MRPYPLTVLNGGINRLRVKGGASAAMLYDLTNAYITNAGTIAPREGTLRFASLDSSTVGLAAANGTFNIFSSAFSTSTPAGFTLNVLQNPVNTAATVTKIWFAKPFLGFEYIVAQFSDNNVFHYWLQNNGTWTSSTDYTSASIVLPPVLNGLAYQGVRDFPSQPNWTPETVITSAHYVEPNSPNGFMYQASAVVGSPAHTGGVEPVWPTTDGATIQEFGDFDQSSSDNGTTQGPYTTGAALNTSITDRYGDSATIANSGVFVTSNSTLSSLTLASTKVKTWVAGKTYPPGSVVVPTTNQGAFTNAIPDGDFSAGTGWTFTDVGGAGNWAFGTGRPYVAADIEIVGGTSFGADGAYATMTTYALVTPGTSITVNSYVDPNNSGSDLNIWVQLNWYNSTDTLLSFTRSGGAQGGGYRPLSVTGVAPAGAAHVRVAFRAGSGTTSRNTGYVGLVSWTLETPSVITNFLFEAVQPAAGVSAATEPSWPTVLGTTVIDGSVTWKAIGTSIITWTAIPIMRSGLTTPSFPTTIGNTVHDFSTYSNLNMGGYITTTSMSWAAISRQVLDTGNPDTVAVAIGASHVFAGDNDIVPFSAAVNPIDWSSTNNAGYLPTGLNNYGDNPVTALALYRGNLIVFNASGYQMWQIDPDPQNMAFLDAQPVGCIWTRSAQSVANDLIFLTEVGVRNLGTIGATANMAIGNTGQPIDPLVVPQFPTTGGVGSSDPYFSDVTMLLPLSSATDISQTGNTILNGGVTFSQYNGPFTIAGYASFAQYMTGDNWSIDTMSTVVSPGSPLDLGTTGDFTVEAYVQFQTAVTQSYCIVGDWGPPGNNGPWELYWDNTNGCFSFAWQNNISGSYTAKGPILSPVPGTWYYVAVVRSGGTITVYLNGSSTGGTPTTPPGTAERVTSGKIWVGGNGSNFGYSPIGNMSNIQITKGVARYTANYTPPTTPFGTPLTVGYDPFTIYYPGRGQYWLIFGPQAFVLTINGLQGTKSWSRYIFPQAITDATLNSGSLFLRTTGNTILQLQASQNMDDVHLTTLGTNILSTVQWPYLDMGGLGLNKMLIGVDLVGEGSTTAQVAFDQQDKSTFVDNANFAASTGVTAPYFIAIDDTVPGEPLPIPINAPSYSLILTFDGGTIATPNNWSFEAANFYLAPQGGGGVTG